MLQGTHLQFFKWVEGNKEKEENGKLKKEVEELIARLNAIIRRTKGNYQDELLEFKDILNWQLLSTNENLPWSAEFIENFKDKWDWKKLSRNKSLPWSMWAMMEKLRICFTG